MVMPGRMKVGSLRQDQAARTSALSLSQGSFAENQTGRWDQ